MTWLLYGVVFAIGVLVGLELPLLMRIIKDQLDFKELVSRVLTFDYIGALLASILFPLVLVPKLGLVRSSLAFGLLNAGVGLWATWSLREMIQGSVRGLRVPNGRGERRERRHDSEDRDPSARTRAAET